ncbi:hypothetical protein [Mycobacteroides chelonae]|uniref:hypothetical protein n=1 Tax=Mycobacteroides chelonae TaxID=1774 RepID=UPI0008A8E51A|nr:hypothetical protein [Mycobacteroides chelonae]OHU29016.1 hypothetical protein BKG78_23370 [Mycobacteroides chelonae]
MSVVSTEQIVSLRTASGKQLYQFLANDQVSLKWTREQRQVSIFDMQVPSVLDSGRRMDITPWLHWVDVFDGQGRELYWSGPIQRVLASRSRTAISARDMSALMTRTRCPLTKRWDAADPSKIAGEMWAAMIELHGLNTRPIERVDPRGDRFDFDAIADEVMMSATIDQLVGLGMHWTVVGGVPILGPAQLKPIAALGENDFVDGEFSIERDGTESYNDVLLRGGDNLSRASVPMGGLRLQTITNIDDMFGVSNVDRAAKQYVRYTGAIKDTLVLTDGAVLHPDAPVDISQLVPSVRVTVEALGVVQLMELQNVTVTGDGSVAVTLSSVNDDLPELVEIGQKGTVTR